MAKKLITNESVPARKGSNDSILSDQNLVLIITTAATAIGGVIALPITLGPIFGKGTDSIVLSIAGAVIGAIVSIVTELKRRMKNK